MYLAVMDNKLIAWSTGLSTSSQIPQLYDLVYLFTTSISSLHFSKSIRSKEENWKFATNWSFDNRYKDIFVYSDNKGKFIVY